MRGVITKSVVIPFIMLMTVSLCHAPVFAEELPVGTTMTLFASTYLWDAPDIDAEKVAIIQEPTEAEITGECDGDRYPVKVGMFEGYIDKYVLDRTINGQPYYNEDEKEQLREDIVKYALLYIGNPYVWGGTSLTDGCDCSGFVQTVFADHGIYLPRTSQEQGVFGTRKDIPDARKGDLILYFDGVEAYHVALYIGDYRVVQASNSRDGIVVTDVNGSAWAIDVIG